MVNQFVESPDFLQTVVDEATKNSEEAKRLVADLREDQLFWTSSPTTWSIAQCLDHLAVTSREFETHLIPAITQGRSKWPISSPVRYQPTWVGGWLIRQVVPETVRKVSAPKVFRPAESPRIENALENFLGQQERFLGSVDDAQGIDFNKTRLRSPVTRFIRYSVADAFVVTVVHGWRHLAQARRVREESGFPG